MTAAIVVNELTPGEFALRLNTLRGTAVYAAYLAASDKVDVATTELQEEFQAFDQDAAIARRSPVDAAALISALAVDPAEILLINTRSFTATD